MLYRAALGLVSLLLLSAQTSKPSIKPYEGELLQLVETLGSIAYLSDLCAEADPTLWRTRVAEILEAESGNPALRERLAGSYNRGFQGYQSTHRTCTDRSKAALDLLLETGQRQSQRLRSRYGG
jgi:uncharacterized protein (TIGR02301 family)